MLPQDPFRCQHGSAGGGIRRSPPRLGGSHLLFERQQGADAKKLDPTPDVLELDVTDEAHWAELSKELQRRWRSLDGALHAVAYAPPSCLGASFMEAPWSDVATALHVSTYSLAALARWTSPLMADGGSIVGLDFDSRQAWPVYNWMGVAKSALESTARYLARELGPKKIRVNLVAAGPIKTVAASGFSMAGALDSMWNTRAPLGWSTDDRTPVAAACVALWSDLLRATTGEILHVDGGYLSQAT